jgi:hypothetical protein
LIDEGEVRELLRTREGSLFHREGQTLEFKEQFNFAGLAEYFKDFAAFSNNRGGYLIFGVKDRPRVLIGMSKKSVDSFEKIDAERLSGYLMDIFSSDIRWEQCSIAIEDMSFGVFRIYESETKPVIARKDEGKDQTIKNGEIYYRYGGRTQRILSAELESMIASRIERNNRDWIDHVKAIGSEGPRNAILLKSEESLRSNEVSSLVIDANLAKQIKFIREGMFSEKDGARTLRLVGDVEAVNAIEVERVVKQNIFEDYPYTGRELCKKVKSKDSSIKESDVWRTIAENGIKGDPNYSIYNYRNKKEEENHKRTGLISSTTPVLYNDSAVNLVLQILRQ